MKASKKQVRGKGFSLILLFGLLIGLGVIWSKSYPKEKSIEFSGQIPITQAEDTGFVVDIPQRGYFKSQVTISVEAEEGDNCLLEYITPAGMLSEAEGLGETQPNAEGLCSWRWVIEESTRKGAGRLLINVNEVGETHFIEIRSGY